MNIKVFYAITDDLVFKHLFSREEILRDFLNSYYEYMNEQLKVVRVKSNIDEVIKGSKRKYKVYYGDIMAYIDNGEIVSIEMYQQFGKKEYQKSLSYISRKYANQYERGKEYKGRKVTGINIIKHNYYKRSKISDYVFVDKIDMEINKEYLEMILINVEEVKKMVYNKEEKRFIRWIRLIGAESMEEIKRIGGSDEVMEQAIKYMEEFLKDEEIQDIYDKIADVEYNAEQAGIIKTAKNMIQNGLSVSEIMKYTGLSKEEVEALE